MKNKNKKQTSFKNETIGVLLFFAIILGVGYYGETNLITKQRINYENQETNQEIINSDDRC